MTEELFLLDANTFITPYKRYYPFDFAPGYWNQLQKHLGKNNVFLLDVAHEEVIKTKDILSEWLTDMNDLNVIDRRNADILTVYGEILSFLQNSPYYTEQALRRWSDEGIADPWLIAAAKVLGATLVTFETSAGEIANGSPSSKPKIPDIARVFDVRCENLFYFIRSMGIIWEEKSA